MKRILYDMSPLTLVRWLLQSFEVWATLQTKIQAEKGPPHHPKIENKKCVLNWLLGKIQCFKPMFFFLVENRLSLTPPSGIFH